MLKEIWLDLERHPNKIKALLLNRGCHALLIYRISNQIYKLNVPLFPDVLTRLIQIFYSIDIDYRSTIAGGLLIVHGVGVVIGRGVIIGQNVKIYHGVTLGINDSGNGEGDFPTIADNVLIGAGACVLGGVHVGTASRIGANSVLIKDLGENETFSSFRK